MCQAEVTEWDPADLNSDGEVDVADVRIFLENLNTMVFRDLNLDGALNQADLEVAKRLIDYVNQTVKYNPAQLILADLNRDSKVDASDAALADAYRDLNGNGSIDGMDSVL